MSVFFFGGGGWEVLVIYFVSVFGVYMSSTNNSVVFPCHKNENKLCRECCRCFHLVEMTAIFNTTFHPFILQVMSRVVFLNRSFKLPVVSWNQTLMNIVYRHVYVLCAFVPECALGSSRGAFRTDLCHMKKLPQFADYMGVCLFIS